MPSFLKTSTSPGSCFSDPKMETVRFLHSQPGGGQRVQRGGGVYFHLWTEGPQLPREALAAGAGPAPACSPGRSASSSDSRATRIDPRKGHSLPTPQVKKRSTERSGSSPRVPQPARGGPAHGPGVWSRVRALQPAIWPRGRWGQIARGGRPVHWPPLKGRPWA